MNSEIVYVKVPVSELPKESNYYPVVYVGNDTIQYEYFNTESQSWLSPDWLQKQFWLKPMPTSELLRRSAVKILRHDQPYSLPDVLKHLISASETLLHKRDYSGEDYEEIERSIEGAKEIITAHDELFTTAQTKST